MTTDSRKAHHRALVINVLLILAAVALLFLFFSMNLFQGGGDLFNKEAARKLHFKGDVSFRDMSVKQRTHLAKILNKYEQALERVEVVVSKQDSYAELQKGTQMLYEIRIRLQGGGRMSSPVRRTTWERLGKDVAAKVDKDLKGYAAMHGGRLKTGSGNLIINSM
ncbi:hypothetical protein [Pseudodesulfovibrio senegalensis]|uniref:Uncharacterized protein n=1 Tax=Pseudodesulfovibrio senegalensis TaxID=1721087 RepID=A0A6N6N1K3_9BACT|nr:hypothetical protein [Pseudodesulfovibrio senegalensis]KAB1441774.1 hypothetical protein F8A88_09290 [Pseudodesulfovibrio senegalensis]